MSIGEISRLLKERFGHDVHIDGDLIETATGGLALTVRGNGAAQDLQQASDGAGEAHRGGGRVRLLEIPAHGIHFSMKSSVGPMICLIG